MIAVASKRVLIVCPDLNEPSGQLGSDLYDALEHGNLPVLAPTTKQLDWTNQAKVQEYFSQHKPHLVINLLLAGTVLTHRFADKNTVQSLIEATRNIAEGCATTDSMVLHLSDYHVFGGETKSTYTESDAPAPLGDFGHTILELEQTISTTVERHAILRLSWLIGIHNENLLTRILDCLMTGGEMTLSRYRRGGPTWEEDAVRVLSGVVRQMMSGAENWGIFHYCSDDACNEWEFGQHVYDVLNSLRETRGELIVDQDKDVEEDEQEPASATLSCRRIRNNFGVHPRTWRQGMKANVTKWLADHADVKAHFPSTAI